MSTQLHQRRGDKSQPKASPMVAEEAAASVFLNIVPNAQNKVSYAFKEPSVRAEISLYSAFVEIAVVGMFVALLAFGYITYSERSIHFAITLSGTTVVTGFVYFLRILCMMSSRDPVDEVARSMDVTDVSFDTPALLDSNPTSLTLFNYFKRNALDTRMSFSYVKGAFRSKDDTNTALNAMVSTVVSEGVKTERVSIIPTDIAEEGDVSLPPSPTNATAATVDLTPFHSSSSSSESVSPTGRRKPQIDIAASLDDTIQVENDDEVSLVSDVTEVKQTVPQTPTSRKNKPSFSDSGSGISIDLATPTPLATRTQFGLPFLQPGKTFGQIVRSVAVAERKLVVNQGIPKILYMFTPPALPSVQLLDATHPSPVSSLFATSYLRGLPIDVIVCPPSYTVLSLTKAFMGPAWGTVPVVCLEAIDNQVFDESITLNEFDNDIECLKRDFPDVVFDLLNDSNPATAASVFSPAPQLSAVLSKKNTSMSHLDRVYQALDERENDIILKNTHVATPAHQMLAALWLLEAKYVGVIGSAKQASSLVKVMGIEQTNADNTTPDDWQAFATFGIRLIQ